MAIGGRRRHTALQNIDSERAPFKGMDVFIAPRASGGLVGGEVVWVPGVVPRGSTGRGRGRGRQEVLLSWTGTPVLAMPCGRDEGQKRTTDGS